MKERKNERTKERRGKIEKKGKSEEGVSKVSK